MSDFSHKQFQGQLYTFEHLKPIILGLDLVINRVDQTIRIFVTFGCHCFTEEFDSSKHREEHVYRYLRELRAFDPLRYQCSKHLPTVMQTLLNGLIYRSDKSYTYVSQIVIDSPNGPKPYSIFFSLERMGSDNAVDLKLYVKSAYISPLKSGKNAQRWRFKGLVCDVLGVS